MPPTASELSSPPPASNDAFTAAKISPAARTAVLGAIELVAADLAATEVALAGLLHSDIAEIPQVAGHVALAGGKRLRPLVALLGARAADFQSPHRVTIAAVGELVHTATLLHDDVVDLGEFRRGRPAARIRYGNGMAVLTGDFCLCSGLVAIADSGQTHAYRTLAQTVMRMTEGEVAQLSSAGSVPTRARYYDIVDRKTAALIAWCASVGGLVEHGAPALSRYGTELGYAFQIADDVLDLGPRNGLAAGGPGVTGKERGQDLRDGKVTLPLALACDADPALAHRVDRLLGAGPPMSAHAVEAVLDTLHQSDAVARATAIAHAHAAKAREALQALPASPARTALHELAGYVVRRDR